MFNNLQLPAEQPAPYAAELYAQYQQTFPPVPMSQEQMQMMMVAYEEHVKTLAPYNNFYYGSGSNQPYPNYGAPSYPMNAGAPGAPGAPAHLHMAPAPVYPQMHHAPHCPNHFPGYPTYQHPHCHPYKFPEGGKRQFTEQQLGALTARYNECQFIKKKDRCILARQIGLSEQQVKVWFQNRRHKIRVDEKIAEEQRDERLNMAGARAAMEELLRIVKTESNDETSESDE